MWEEGEEQQKKDSSKMTFCPVLLLEDFSRKFERSNLTWLKAILYEETLFSIFSHCQLGEESVVCDFVMVLVGFRVDEEMHFLWKYSELFLL